MPDFNPHSTDAMFSKIIQRLDRQDESFSEHRIELRSMVKDFKNDLEKIEDRVIPLEKELWKNRGIVAAIGLAIPLFWQWLTSPNTLKH